MAAETSSTQPAARHRPRWLTVFAAAFIAGAAAAVGVNRALDVHLAQRRPQVECEPIFVALRPLQQGSPVTVWDVALKDWPRAMLPASALRAGDSFEGLVLRHAVREGQPLLAVQLVRPGTVLTAGTVAGDIAAETFPAPLPAMPAADATRTDVSPASDPWMPAAAVGDPTGRDVAAAPAAASPPPTSSDIDAPTSVDASSSGQPPTGADAPVAAMPKTDADLGPTIAEPAVTDQQPSDVAVAPTPTIAPLTDVAEEPAMTESLATDIHAMPSVMTATNRTMTGDSPRRQDETPAGGRAGDDAGRYLVVPERIALQADASFAMPQPQPPAPPAATAAAVQRPRPQTQPQPQTQTQTATPQAGPRRSQPGRPQAGRGAQQQSRQQAQPQQQKQPQPPRTPAQQPAQKTAAASRSWGGMFPTMAAGIEALGGSWQRSRTEGQPARR
ncbi:MAG: SAF domain-containing protein [Planctomycetaceae bacterium]